jgi:hypothetical protein
MTKQEFDQLQNELEMSGKTLKSFMVGKELPIHQYYYWKKKYYTRDDLNQTGRFIRIGSLEQTNAAIRLEYPNGVTLNFQSYPGSETLLSLINSKK